jgi:hypothetical protein
MTRGYFEEKFGEMPDRRYQGFVEHKLTDVLIIIVCGVLCGLDEPERIALFGKERIGFFKERFGIEKAPSESTVLRILNIVDGDAIADAVIEIMRETRQAPHRSRGQGRRLRALSALARQRAATSSPASRSAHIRE